MLSAAPAKPAAVSDASAGKPPPQRRERQAWTGRGNLCIAAPVVPPFRCVWLLAALALPPAGNADIGATGRLLPERDAPPFLQEADGPALLFPLETSARKAWRDGDLVRATALRRRALRIARASFSPEAPETVQAVTALAQAHIDRRRWLDAEPLLILAAAMPGKADGNGNKAAIYAGLARIALARGDAGAALAWASRAVESARRTPRHISAEPLRAFGAALAGLRRFEEARQVLDEALASDRSRYGPEAAETARSLAQLGNLYLRWNRPGEALPLLQETAAIDQARLGPDHPFIADDLHDLGLAYEALNRPDQARRMFVAALAVLERSAERATPRAAYTSIALARVHRKLGDDPAAENAERAARRILNEAEAEERRRERRV
jgi:tetratricopeptide (TPR) repeat protein